MQESPTQVRYRLRFSWEDRPPREKSFQSEEDREQYIARNVTIAACKRQGISHIEMVDVLTCYAAERQFKDMPTPDYNDENKFQFALDKGPLTKFALRPLPAVYKKKKRPVPNMEYRIVAWYYSRLLGLYTASFSARTHEARRQLLKELLHQNRRHVFDNSIIKACRLSYEDALTVYGVKPDPAAWLDHLKDKTLR